MFGNTNPFGQSSTGPSGQASTFPHASHQQFLRSTPLEHRVEVHFSAGHQQGSLNRPIHPFTTAPTFGAPSSLVFGVPASAFITTSTPAFGATSTPVGFSLFGQKPEGIRSATAQPNPYGSTFLQTQSAFGSSTIGSTSPFGSSSKPAVGATNTTDFGSTPAFGTVRTTPFVNTSISAFGALPTPAFSASSNPAFGASNPPAFGGTSTPAFGSTTYGSAGCAFGVSNAPAFGSSTATFGAGRSSPFYGSSTNTNASSTPAFGSTIPYVGTSSTPSFIFGFTPAFGQPTSALGSIAFGTPSFGAEGSQSGSFICIGSNGAQSRTPTFGSPGFGQPAFGTQQAGTRVVSYSPTPEADGSTTGSHTIGCLGSVPAMPANKKSHEKLRSEDYQQGDEGAQPIILNSSNPCFGHRTLEAQQVGSRVMPYSATPEVNGSTTGEVVSISAMPAYKEKSHEELRCEDYQRGDKGAQSTIQTFGSPSFGQSALGTLQAGIRVLPYCAIPKDDDSTNGKLELSSIDTRQEKSRCEECLQGAQPKSPTFGSQDLDSSDLETQQAGKRGTTYNAASEVDGSTTGVLESVSFQKIYDDYIKGDEGAQPKTPTFGGQGLDSSELETQQAGKRGTTYNAASEVDGSTTGILESVSIQKNYDDYIKGDEEGANSTTPAFVSSGFGPLESGRQQAGRGVVPHIATPEVHGSLTRKLESLSNEKSHEEFSCEDYQRGDKVQSPPMISGSKGFDPLELGSQQAGSQAEPCSATVGADGSNIAKLVSLSKEKSLDELRCEDYQRGANSTTSFGNPGLGQLELGTQQAGSRAVRYIATPEADGSTIGLPITRNLESVSAMPAYKEKSHEELRCEDYQRGDKGETSTTPSFGNPSLSALNLGTQQTTSRVVRFIATPEAGGNIIGSLTPGKLQSISAMPAYKEKSHEELRFEDYQLGIKGSPSHVQSQSGIRFSAPAQTSLFGSIGTSGLTETATIYMFYTYTV